MRRLLVCASLLASALALTAQTARPKSAPEYRIAGVVYDAISGQTLPSARISLGNTATSRVPDRSVLTGPDGSFAFDHLAAGKYQMFGDAVGYPQQGFEQHEAPFLTGIVVGPDASADHLAFRLQRGCAISGTVTDEFNEAVRSAQVILFRRGLDNGRFSTHFSRETTTDDLGHYKFAPLLPGTYFVVVQARPWYAQNGNDQFAETVASPQVIEGMKRLDVAFPLTFYSGASDADDATPITVRSGDRATADFALHSVPSARIVIPLPGANTPAFFVRLTQPIFGDFDLPVEAVQSRVVPRRGDDGASGLFEDVLSGIAPGTYLAHLTAPSTGGDRAQEIEIDGDTTLDPDTFQEHETASVHAVVRMNGNPAALRNAVIVLRNRKTNQGQGERPDDKGQMDFKNLTPGTYELSVANVGDNYLLQIISTNAKVNGRDITISASSPAEVAITLGEGMGEIHGVALRDGKGVSGTLVLLVPDNPDANTVLFRRDQSDSDGTFALQRIVPGKYSVVSIEDGWGLEWSKSAVLKPYLAKAQKIEVAAGGKYDIKVPVQKK